MPKTAYAQQAARQAALQVCAQRARAGSKSRGAAQKDERREVVG